MRRSLFVLAVAALVLLGPAPARAQGGPGLSIRLLDAPADRRDDPRARIYIVDHLKQGDRIQRHVELANGTDAPLTVSVYAAAAKVAGGQFRFGDGHAANDLTRWTRVEPAQLVLPPHGTGTAAVTIAVPTDATDGERYGVVWAELPGSGGATNVVNRVGVRI